MEILYLPFFRNFACCYLLRWIRNHLIFMGAKAISCQWFVLDFEILNIFVNFKTLWPEGQWFDLQLFLSTEPLVTPYRFHCSSLTCVCEKNSISFNIQWVLSSFSALLLHLFLLLNATKPHSPAHSYRQTASPILFLFILFYTSQMQAVYYVSLLLHRQTHTKLTSMHMILLIGHCDRHTVFQWSIHKIKQ